MHILSEEARASGTNEKKGVEGMNGVYLTALVDWEWVLVDAIT